MSEFDIVVKAVTSQGRNMCNVSICVDATGGCALAKEGYLRLKNVEHTEKYAQQRTTDDVSLFAGNQHRPATAKAEVTPHPGHSCSPAKQVLTDSWITWNIWISFCDA